MELKTLSANLKYLTPNGITLNIEEKMQVMLALSQLQCEMNFEELFFWGKVEGKNLFYYCFFSNNYFYNYYGAKL
jgi:hypothetical protein